MIKALDRDVRASLHAFLGGTVASLPGSVIIDELTLQRKDGRIDVAVVNTLLHGYEIKSQADTLERLDRQMPIYGKVFDYLSVAVDARHLKLVQKKIPAFWGVHVWLPKAGIAVVRPPQRNSEVSKKALVQMLWREEALALLTSIGEEKGITSKPKWALWEKIEKVCEILDVHYAVREQLRGHRRLEKAV